MMDDEEFDDGRAAHGEFLDTIGVEDFFSRVYAGREKELMLDPTDAQLKLVEKYSRSLYTSSSCPPFDIMDARRLIIHQGKVQKKTAHSLVQMFQKRYLFLLNDALLVTSVHTPPSSVMMKSKEKYEILEILPLNAISVNNLSYLEPHDSNSFEIVHEDRVLEFQTESESEKRIWVEKIVLAVHSCYKLRDGLDPAGWHHVVAAGTLHWAAYEGNVDRLSLHLTILADRSPDIVDEVGMYPLHWAALRGHRAAVIQLLDAGSEVDLLNNGLNTPLMLAASQGHELVVNTLLERGADPFARNLKDRDALFMAALYAPNARGLAKIFMFLHFRGVDLNRRDSSGSAPLHECAARNLSRPVRLLVDAGALVNNKHGRTGMTPLQVACGNENPDVETIRSLLEKGAHPNWKDGHNMTAFEHVLRKNLVPVSTPAPEQRVASSDGPSRVASPQTPEQMAQTVQDVGMFVTKALPVLIELARKGGRYTEDLIQHLRPSFLAAIDSGRIFWNKAAEPEHFEAYVRAKDTLKSRPSEWTSDKASGHCLLCLNKFGYFGRHHCRACGILCCELCSSKRLSLRYPAPKGGADRVCDGCFNRLSAQAEARMLAVAKAQKIMDSQPVEEQKPDGKDEADIARGSSFSSNFTASPTTTADDSPKGMRKVLSNGSLSGGASPVNPVLEKSTSGDQLSKQNAASRSVGSTNAALSEVSEALRERGSRIQAVGEKSEALMEGASEFSRMARQLKQKQKRKSSII